jgi:hypothetical protein
MHSHMLLSGGSLRVNRDKAHVEEGDIYLSPIELVSRLEQAIRNELPNGKTVLYDPSASDGRLLRPFEQDHDITIVNRDIFPRHPSVQEHNYLNDSSKRPKEAKGEHMMIVFNPPFELPSKVKNTLKEYNGMTAFVNKSFKIMKVGEKVISIANHNMSNINKIQKVNPFMHLKTEYIRLNPHKFVKFDKKNNSPYRNKRGQEVKKPVCIVIQVWEKSNVPREEKYPVWKTQFKLSAPEINELPFQIKRFPSTGHYREKRVPDMLLYWHSPGKFSLMVIDDPKLTMETLNNPDYFDAKMSKYRKRWRQGRKTVCKGTCILPFEKGAKLASEEKRKMSKRCHKQKHLQHCTSPCRWVKGPCSYVEEKELGFTRGVSMYYVMVDDPRNKREVKRRFHEVYSRGYPLRYFGFSYHCGSQQATLDIAYYMYKHGFPTREKFGIETIFDDSEEAEEYRRKMKELADINNMYDILSRGGIRKMKEYVHRVEAVRGGRNNDLRRLANRLMI